MHVTKLGNNLLGLIDLRRQRFRPRSVAEIVGTCRFQRRFVSRPAVSSERLQEDSKHNNNGKNNSFHSSSNSTVRPGEIEKFEKLSGTWWSSSGPMKELRSMNALRFVWIYSLG